MVERILLDLISYVLLIVVSLSIGYIGMTVYSKIKNTVHYETKRKSPYSGIIKNLTYLTSRSKEASTGKQPKSKRQRKGINVDVIIGDKEKGTNNRVRGP